MDCPGGGIGRRFTEQMEVHTSKIHRVGSNPTPDTTRLDHHE